MTKEELELERLRAEIAKLHAETEAQQPSVMKRLGEGLKILGAVVAAVAASYAAFETYRVTQVETKLANFEKDRAVREKFAAERELAEALQRSAQAKQDLAAVRAAVGAAQIQLAVARRNAATPAQVKRIDNVSDQLQNVGRSSPTSSRKIQVTSADTVADRAEAERIAVGLISRGYVSAYVLLPAEYEPPDTTLIVFQRSADGDTAEELRTFLASQRIYSRFLMDRVDTAHPDAMEIRMARVQQ